MSQCFSSMLRLLQSLKESGKKMLQHHLMGLDNIPAPIPVNYLYFPTLAQISILLPNECNKHAEIQPHSLCKSFYSIGMAVKGYRFDLINPHQHAFIKYSFCEDCCLQSFEHLFMCTRDLSHIQHILLPIFQVSHGLFLAFLT